jgi:GDP-L-fucose synthase
MVFSVRVKGAYAGKFGDLCYPSHIDEAFDAVKPDVVIHAAAFVGGIGQQTEAPYDLCHKNLLMACNVVDACVRHKARLIAFSSVCAMPAYVALDAERANIRGLEEGDLHRGMPPVQNWHYGHAKRMIDVLIDGAAKQHGLQGCTLIPANIFGTHDNYRLGTCHVVPALIHKLYQARKNGEPLRVWGDGSSEREFLSSDDVARIVMRLVDLPELPPRLIVSSGESVTIRELVDQLHKAVGRREPFPTYETDKPNGQRRRPTDTSLLRSLLPDFRFEPLGEALNRAYDWFASEYPNVRI